MRMGRQRLCRPQLYIYVWSDSPSRGCCDGVYIPMAAVRSVSVALLLLRAVAGCLFWLVVVP